jgi:probable rRNA maturation factor
MSKRTSRVTLVVEAGPHPGLPSRTEIARRARAMMRALQLEKEELSLVLTGDVQIQKLNKVYRQKNKPTDVLAFAQREGEFASVAGDLLGDVIVSIPTARRQAEARGAALVDEVTMLVAHGLLHLLGWDHDTAAKDRRMRAETDRLVAAAASPPRPARGSRARKPSTARAQSHQTRRG